MDKRAAEFYVVVVETETGAVVKRLGPLASERQADRVDDGVMRNLNHERFHTEVVPHTHKLATVEVVEVVA
jgi:hypothetical protein